MQSKSILWKRRCGRNHGFEMFHGSWALRWLHDDSLHTETKMRHKRIKRSCKNWVISYILIPVLLSSWSAGWQDGHWWVIFIGFLQGQLLGYHGFWKIWWYARPYLLCSFYLPFPAYEYFSSISCGGNSTTRSSIWNCCHKISSLADTVMKILSYFME